MGQEPPCGRRDAQTWGRDTPGRHELRVRCPVLARLQRGHVHACRYIAHLDGLVASRLDCRRAGIM